VRPAYPSLHPRRAGIFPGHLRGTSTRSLTWSVDRRTVSAPKSYARFGGRRDPGQRMLLSSTALQRPQDAGPLSRHPRPRPEGLAGGTRLPRPRAAAPANDGARDMRWRSACTRRRRECLKRSRGMTTASTHSPVAHRSSFPRALDRPRVRARSRCPTSAQAPRAAIEELQWPFAVGVPRCSARVGRSRAALSRQAAASRKRGRPHHGPPSFALVLSAVSRR